jgi:DNA-binding transcriptional ArsR family regulator
VSTEPGPRAGPDPGHGDGKPPAGRRDLDDIDAVFGALAHATRRHVLQVLAARHGEMTAGELSGRFSHSWPTTTRHLAVLVDAGLVAVERVGRERRYRLQRQRLGDVLALWLGSVGYALHDDGDLERGST